jgi:hypothetical protein
MDSPSAQQRPKRSQQLGSSLNKLDAMVFAQGAEDLFSLRSKPNCDASQIRLVLPAFDKSFSYRAVDQLYRAIVLDEETPREILNAGDGSRWGSFHRKHELVLLRFDTNFSCHAGTEVQKPANLEAELRKVLVVREKSHGSLNYIVQRHNYNATEDWRAMHGSGKMVGFRKCLRRLR